MHVDNLAGRRANVDELAWCVAEHLEAGRHAEAWDIVGEVETLAGVRFPDEAGVPHTEVARPGPGVIGRRFARAHRALLAARTAARSAVTA